MSDVWVVLDGTDSEGGWVIGVCGTAEAARQLAESNTTAPLTWRETDPGREWFARNGEDRYSVSYYEVTRWPVLADEPHPDRV